MVPLKVLALARTEYVDAIRGLLGDLIQFPVQKRIRFDKAMTNND